MSWRQLRHQCLCFHYWDYLTNFWHNNWRSIIDVVERLLFQPLQIFFLEALAFLEVVESTLERLNSLTLVLKVVIKKAMVICCQNQTKSLMNVGLGKNILFCLMKRSLYILADGMLTFSHKILEYIYRNSSKRSSVNFFLALVRHSPLDGVGVAGFFYFRRKTLELSYRGSFYC